MASRPLDDVIQHIRRAVLPVREEMTDGKLLGAFLQQRDDAALAALVCRHGPMVWGVCSRVLRHHQNAEDAFQATFLVLVRKAATIRRQERVASWLYGVAYQTALKARALATRRSVRERQVTEMPEPDQADSDMWTELQPLLDQELSRMPHQYRVPIVLCDLEGKTRQEAARQLGWPEGTVATRLAKARAMLTKRFARHGLAVSAGTLAAMVSQNGAAACVPTSVMSSTIKAATLLAAGQSVVRSVISMNVAALTEGVAKAMFLTKLKMGMALLLVVALGLALMMHSALAQRQGQGEPEAKDRERQPKGDLDDPRQRAEEPKLRATLQGHTQPVQSVAFSPDGKTIASGSRDMTIKLWDVATGKERATLMGHSNYVVFSPDSKSLASFGGSDMTVKLWDVSTGKERATFRGHTRPLYGLAFSPDGKTIASGSFDNTVKLWDMATARVRSTVNFPTSIGIWGFLALSPDGKTLALTSEDETVKLLDVSTGKEQATLKGHTGFVYSVSFSPDGKTVASGSMDKTVKLWELATRKERANFHPSRHISSVAFSPDGKTLASGLDSNRVTLWDVASGKKRATLLGHNWAVNCVAFSPDGKTLASPVGDKINLWDMPATKQAESAQSGGLSPKDMDGLWTALGSDDAALAYRAIGSLTEAHQQAIAMMKERLRPAPKPKVQQITRLIDDLDDNKFSVRQKAREALEKKGEQAKASLRKKLTEKPSLEVRRQIAEVLAKIDQHLSAESLRALRAVEVLEHVRSAEAKQVLEALAKGAEGFRLTTDAKASLDRLDQRVAVSR